MACPIWASAGSSRKFNNCNKSRRPSQPKRPPDGGWNSGGRWWEALPIPMTASTIARTLIWAEWTIRTTSAPSTRSSTAWPDRPSTVRRPSTTWTHTRRSESRIICLLRRLIRTTSSSRTTPPRSTWGGCWATGRTRTPATPWNAESSSWSTTPSAVIAARRRPAALTTPICPIRTGAGRFTTSTSCGIRPAATLNSAGLARESAAKVTDLRTVCRPTSIAATITTTCTTTINIRAACKSSRWSEPEIWCQWPSRSFRTISRCPCITCRPKRLIICSPSPAAEFPPPCGMNRLPARANGLFRRCLPGSSRGRSAVTPTPSTTRRLRATNRLIRCLLAVASRRPSLACPLNTSDKNKNKRKQNKFST